MTPTSALLAALRQGNLLPPEQLPEAERLANSSPSASALAAALAGRGWLTQYQTRELCAGRGAGLAIGPYVLLEKLGEGGMGEVFRARHTGKGGEVALKRILTNRLDSPSTVDRFLREVRAVSMLSHPNVVRFYEAGEIDGAHYLAMELLRGVDLAKYLGRRGPLPVEEAVEYVRQACAGMQHAHEKGLVHRDLKPANLMLTQQRQIKILDMGLALVAQATTMTQAGGSFGTVDYMAPEQVKDSHKVDVRADVYSLGCTLYHLLTGSTPFADTHPAARPAMHLTQEPPPLDQRRAEVPPEVVGVVRKMMAKEREQRYQTPGEAGVALGALRRGNRAGGAQQSPRTPHAPSSTSPEQATRALESEVIEDVEGEAPAEPLSPRRAGSRSGHLRKKADSTPPTVSTARAEPPKWGVRRLLLAGAVVGVLLVGLTVAVVLSLPSKTTEGSPPVSLSKDGGTGKQPDEPKKDDEQKAAGGKDKNPPNDKGKAPGDKDRKKDDDKDKEPKVAEGPRDKQWENSIGMKFVRIPKGKFTMGSPKTDTNRSTDEEEHEVELTKDFYLGVHEVTQKQWKAVMEGNPSWFSREGSGKNKVKDFEDVDLDDFPVERVSWQDAQEFLKKLNEREKKTLNGWEYRLPTEAEWEYSCRGGATEYKKYHFGDSLSPKQANYSNSKFGRTEKVGSYPANAFGLHDMHGNVWEWCHDWYDSKYYANSPKIDPLGSPGGSDRVVRGGSWRLIGQGCRAALRYSISPSLRFNDLGFRVAVVPAR